MFIAGHCGGEVVSESLKSGGQAGTGPWAFLLLGPGCALESQSQCDTVTSDCLTFPSSERAERGEERGCQAVPRPPPFGPGEAAPFSSRVQIRTAGLRSELDPARARLGLAGGRPAEGRQGGVAEFRRLKMTGHIKSGLGLGRESSKSSKKSAPECSRADVSKLQHRHPI